MEVGNDDKLKASLEIVEMLKEAENSGIIDIKEARKRLQL
ncbi:hypothetical protein TKO01_18270 [Tetragenococcus koreensis]|nr:hypothetical protein TKO01_18270 [Tetragenococcus koreensis]